MAAFIGDAVLDAPLDAIAGAAALHICSGSPASGAGAVAASLASVAVTGADFTAGDATPDGRDVTVAPQDGMTVTAGGTPASYCLLDSAGVLLARTDATGPALTEGSGAGVSAVTFRVADPEVVTGTEPLVFDRYAATTGSDSNPGTEESPYLTVAKLIDGLTAGQVGALAPGTYVEDVTVEQGDITITSLDPGTPATIQGRFYIPQGAEDVTVQAVNIDGRNTGGLPSPTVNGSRASFLGCDVTNLNTEIAFNLGHPDFGTPDGVRIAGCRIHDVGAIPRTNLDHGIYISYATNTVVEDNYIYRCADRGIQLYPNAQGTVIRHNTLVDNGSGIIFSGLDDHHSDNTLVENNIIVGSYRFNLEENWAGSEIGSANIVTGNCLLAGNGGGNISPSPAGFTVTDSIIADPQFVDPANDDFTLAPGSPAAGKGPRQ